MSTATLTLEQIIAERQANGTDRWDEVWDGVYQLMPLPNIEHQGIVTRLPRALVVVEDTGLGQVFAGTNVSDQEVDWRQNYRCPDLAVYLNENPAEPRNAYWLGGPDLAVEVVSQGDRSREKLDFYAKVGTRELLLIDRDPWSLELHRLGPDGPALVGRSTPADSLVLASSVLPLGFALVPGREGARPLLRVAHAEGAQVWTI
jgi:Uma2 family endonuclease